MPEAYRFLSILHLLKLWYVESSLIWMNSSQVAVTQVSVISLSLIAIMVKPLIVDDFIFNSDIAGFIRLVDASQHLPTDA